MTLMQGSLWTDKPTESPCHKSQESRLPPGIAKFFTRPDTTGDTTVARNCAQRNRPAAHDFREGIKSPAASLDRREPEEPASRCQKVHESRTLTADGGFSTRPDAKGDVKALRINREVSFQRSLRESPLRNFFPATVTEFCEVRLTHDSAMPPGARLVHAQKKVAHRERNFLIGKEHMKSAVLGEESRATAWAVRLWKNQLLLTRG